MYDKYVPKKCQAMFNDQQFISTVHSVKINFRFRTRKYLPLDLGLIKIFGCPGVELLAVKQTIPSYVNSTYTQLIRH